MKRHLLLTILLQLFTVSGFSYEAHEWGTFTSLVGSNGVTQNGMYHEDEKLPDFVHAFGETQFVFVPPAFDDCNFMKSCFTLPVLQQNFVSQKMETPVIYFYSKEDVRVDVKVDFPEGIITETFPAPYSSFPKNSDDLEFKNGTASFNVNVLAETTLQPPAIEDGNIYGHARDTKSQMVQSNNEVEKFIFYRGLGRFQPKINISSSDGGITIQSDHNHLPSSAFLVHVNDNGYASLLPVIGDGSPIKPTFTKGLNGFTRYFYTLFNEDINALKFPFFSHLSHHIKGGKYAKAAIVNGLVESGLYKDEAVAMVNTWENGYLKVPGLRLLYILPQNEVDEILPLTMTPAPQNIERVFVARLEIMTDKDEVALVKRVIQDKESFDISSLGRFAEPQLRRAEQVYAEMHKKFEAPFEGFEYGLLDVFNTLVNKSITTESAPLVID